MIETFTQRLIRLREEHGLNKSQLARELSRISTRVSRESICKWESGQTKNLRHHNLMGLARLYNVSVDDLFKGTDKTPGELGVQNELTVDHKASDLAEKYRLCDDNTRWLIDTLLNDVSLTKRLAATLRSAAPNHDAEKEFRTGELTPGKAPYLEKQPTSGRGKKHS